MKLFALLTGTLGSDQLVPLDGRYSIATACRKTREYIARLRKHVKPGLITGFQICTGTIRAPTIIHHCKEA